MKHKSARRIVKQFDRIATEEKPGVALDSVITKTCVAMSKAFGRAITKADVLEAIEVVSTKKEKSKCP